MSLWSLLSYTRYIVTFGVCWFTPHPPQLKNPRIWLFLLYLLALFIASFESEGPENHMEKDSWKTLRY